MTADDQKTGANQRLGADGEDVAVTFLLAKGYKVIDRNFRCKCGELDIVARDGGSLVFVEVKTRRSDSYGAPQYAVTPFKQRQISKAALTWLARNRKQGAEARFDVLAISIYGSRPPIFEHIVNAFDLAY